MTSSEHPRAISAVIPAFNAAGRIGAAIESVRSQTVPVREVIVVDDGSEDDTGRVAAQYPGVQVIRRDNGGPGAARNTGIRHSTGDWVALLDADDSWLPGRIEAQLPLLADPSVGLVHARRTLYRGHPAPPEVTVDHLVRRNCIIASSTLIRRTCVDAVGGFDESRELIGVEDYNLWIRIAAAGWRVATCPQWLVRYTQTAASLSRDRRRILEAELFNLRRLTELGHLSPVTTERKITAVLESYGEEFLYRRDLGAARRCYRQLMGREPGFHNAIRLAASWLPRPLLDLRRRAFGPAPVNGSAES
ncbi:MAG: glycosyltransferase family 2 protein [Gemmatimonadales bacterium]